MIHVSEKLLYRWLMPSAMAAVLFLSLLFFIPYAASLYSTKMSLGMLVWTQGWSEGTTAMDYSYCLFVPILFAFLVFIRRKEIAELPIHGSNAAMGLIAFGLILYWFGLRAETQYFGFAAVQLLMAGVIAWLWGWAVFRKLLFPWAFFTFVWPMPFLEPIVAFPLRLIMSQLAGGVLNIVGIHTIQNGTALLSAPDPLTGARLGSRFQIDIADPCSGLRSLFALLMCSALLGYFFVSKLWQQWVIFLSAFPLAIVGNLVRVVMLTIGNILFGTAFAIGTTEHPSFYHEAAGFVVFFVTLGLEFALASFLTTDWKKINTQWNATAKTTRPKKRILDLIFMSVAQTSSNHASAFQASQLLSWAWWKKSVDVPPWRGGVLLLVALVALIAYWINPPLTLSPQAGVIMTLPDQVEIQIPDHAGGKFHGLSQSITEVELSQLPKDTGFARKQYDDFAGHNILCTIVLSGAEQRSIHRPEACLPGQGWNITGHHDVTIKLDSGRNLVVRKLAIDHDVYGTSNEHQVIHGYYIYWFVGENVTTPSHYMRILLSSWDRFAHNRAHRWAYVSVMSPITDSFRSGGLNAEQTQLMLIDFIRKTVPTYQKSEMPAQASN